MALVSIIIPIYNSGQFLDQCLNSLYAQTYKDFEVICVNDGSTDDSEQICRQWLQRDSRIRLISQENKGVSAARNTGLRIAQGTYVCFIDSDDYVDELFLEIQTNLIKDYELSICDYTRKRSLGSMGNRISVCDNSQLIHDIIYEQIKHPNLPCFLFRMKNIQKYSLKFEEGCIRYEDFEFYMKYLLFSAGPTIMSDYVGYFYRETSGSEMESRITAKTLTELDAAGRIKTLLDRYGHPAGRMAAMPRILKYVFELARQNNKELYEYLHDHYDIDDVMKEMVSFPKLSKKCVALAYILLGKNIFFGLVSKQRLCNISRF